jgi:hypothetical protein
MPTVHVVRLTGGRIAIRDRGVLLAVPTLHDDIPRAVRVEVYELVLRRLFGEALDLANAADDARLNKVGTFASIHSLMKATPHKNARGSVAA